MSPSWNNSFCHEPNERDLLRKSKLSRKELSRLSLLKKRGIGDLGRTLDAEKEISNKVPGGSHCLSLLSPFLFLRREMLQGVRLALGCKLHSCRRISCPSLLLGVSRKVGSRFLLKKHAGIWYSCCTLSGWLLQALLCPATSPFSSTQPQSVYSVSSDSQFCTHCQLQDPKRVFSIRKNMVWVFSHYI